MQNVYIVYLYNSGGREWFPVPGRPRKWNQIAFVSTRKAACEIFMEDWAVDSTDLHITFEMGGEHMGDYIAYVSGRHDLGIVFRATIQEVCVSNLVFTLDPNCFQSLPSVGL